MGDRGTTWAVVAAVHGAMSLVTFVAFGVDKARARRGARRVPERTLHLLELSFGVVGALVAMQVFRHKRRKATYWAVTALVAAAHVGLLVALARWA